MTEPWIIPAAIFDRMVAAAEKDFPEETCGLLFGPDDALEVHPMENIQNRLHAEDAAAHPRDATRAYAFDGLVFDRVYREQVDEQLRPLRAFYHSHPNVEAYFSEKDQAGAAPPGWGPLYPETAYIVFSVIEGKLAYTKAFLWSAEDEGYVEIPVRRGDGPSDSDKPDRSRTRSG